MPPKRHTVQHNGQTIYEWDQSLDEINLYFHPPTVISAKDLEIQIEATKLTVGLKGNPPFLKEELYSTVIVEESTWVLDDNEINVTLTKMRNGEVWPAVFKSHQQLDSISQEEARKQIMLERFQTEHPGFDFSNAEFSGAAPDPRTFLGGMSHR